MKRVAVLAMRRAHQAGFTIVHDHELVALDALPLWMTRLFLTLLRVANHATGAGQITYAALMAKLEPLQPRSGPRHFVPTPQALKRAIDTLESRCLIRRDQLHSQATQALVFRVDPRYEKARPRRKLDSQTRPPSGPENFNSDSRLPDTTAETRPPNLTPSSGMNSDHSKDGDLSTARHRLRAVRAALAARGAGGQAGPQGGQSIAPAAHAPQGLRPSKSAQADFSPAGNSHQQTDERAPPAAGHQAHALATAPPAPAAGLLRGEPGNGLSDHATSEARQGPRQAPQASDELAATPRPHPA